MAGLEFQKKLLLGCDQSGDSVIIRLPLETEYYKTGAQY